MVQALWKDVDHWCKLFRRMVQALEKEVDYWCKLFRRMLITGASSYNQLQDCFHAQLSLPYRHKVLAIQSQTTHIHPR